MKVISIFMASIVAAAAVGVVAYQSNGFINWNTDTWFGGKASTELSDPADKTSETDNSLVIMPDAKVAVRKLERSEYAANSVSGDTYGAYTISVTVEPDNATVKTATWSAAFQDPDSAWATGKTVSDYITMSVASGTATTISCNEPFGEKIVVTAILDGNTELSATCILDFSSRAKEFVFYCDYSSPVLLHTNTCSYLYVTPTKDSTRCYFSWVNPTACTIYDLNIGKNFFPIYQVTLSDSFLTYLNSLSDEVFSKREASANIPSSLFQNPGGGYLYVDFCWELANYFLDHDIPDTLLSTLKSQIVSHIFDITCNCDLKGSFMYIGKVEVSFYVANS